MKKLLGLCFIVIYSYSIELKAQSNLKEGDKAFDKHSYALAVDFYKEALEEGLESADVKHIHFKLAESYRLTRDYTLAKKWYEEVLGGKPNGSKASFNYAEVLMHLGEYEKARVYYKSYLRTNSTDFIAKERMSSCDFALEIMEEEQGAEVENLVAINTSFSEFSPLLFKGQFIFASSRIVDEKEGIYQYKGHGYSDFYEVPFHPLHEYGIPQKISGKINSEYNEGTLSIDSVHQVGYFMQCNGYDGKKNTCNIYMSEYDDKKGWKKGEMIVGMDENFNSGHPIIYNNGESLIFSSDMPGGFGGKDLWKMEKENGIWAKATNLGNQINTVGDEVFPYVSNDDKLYFSSDGHKGIGGLDIFKSDIISGSFSKPDHMKMPINSSADDFGILFMDERRGYFASDREGGQGDDDIYSFELIDIKKEEELVIEEDNKEEHTSPTYFNIAGHVKDKQHKDKLSDAIIILTDAEGHNDTTLTNNEGIFLFQNLQRNGDDPVTVKVIKEGYLSDSKSFNANEFYNKKGGLLDLDFDLVKVTQQEVRISNIYYDFQSWKLREESRASLEDLVTILKINPEVKILINSHTDLRGTEDYNLKLSENRAQSVVNFLIDNDVDPKRLSAKGWGESKPIARYAEYEEEHELNRRTTFQIVNYDHVSGFYNSVSYKKIEQKIKEDVEEEGGHVDDKISFSVQIFALKRKAQPYKLKHIQTKIGKVDIYEKRMNDGYYHYTVGSYYQYKDAVNMVEHLNDVGFSNAFVVAFKGESPVNVSKSLYVSSR